LSPPWDAQYAYFARTAMARHRSSAARNMSRRRCRRRCLPIPCIPAHPANCLPPLIVVATVQIANSISLEATLSFLGLGLPPTEPRSAC